MAQDQFIIPLRQVLEQVRDRLNALILRLKAREEPRFMRWRCLARGHIKNSTRTVPAHGGAAMSGCEGTEVRPVP